MENIIEYEGELPQGVLEQRIAPGETYPVETLREIILEAFPQKGKDKFYGLGFIDVREAEDVFFEGRFLHRALKECATREEVIERMVPSFEDVGNEIPVEVHESQIYKDKLKRDNFPYKRHRTRLTLTETGYVLDYHGITQSNNP